jgi:hypothetical protein
MVIDRPSFGGGAPGPERAAGAGCAEGHRAGLAHWPGDAGRAGDRARILLDSEVIHREPAGHGRAQRRGLYHCVMPGVAVGGAGFPAAVLGVTVDLQPFAAGRARRARIAGAVVRARTAGGAVTEPVAGGHRHAVARVAAAFPGGHRHLALGDQPGLRLGGQMAAGSAVTAPT